MKTPSQYTKAADFTGACPPELFSSGSRTYEPSDCLTAQFSSRDLVDKWFIEPLKNTSGDQAFVCLSVCIHLYEKYLRSTPYINEGQTFSEGHKVFKQIGKDFGIRADYAFEFWKSWRNGLSHHGMPYISGRFDWGLAGGQQQIVLISGRTFTINPWLLRDMILAKVKSEQKIWKDQLTPLMRAFRIVEL